MWPLLNFTEKAITAIDPYYNPLSTLNEEDALNSHHKHKKERELWDELFLPR